VLALKALQTGIDFEYWWANLLALALNRIFSSYLYWIPEMTSSLKKRLSVLFNCVLRLSLSVGETWTLGYWTKLLFKKKQYRPRLIWGDQGLNFDRFFCCISVDMFVYSTQSVLELITHFAARKWHRLDFISLFKSLTTLFIESIVGLLHLILTILKLLDILHSRTDGTQFQVWWRHRRPEMMTPFNGTCIIKWSAACLVSISRA
jgi:hypothetical protein